MVLGKGTFVNHSNTSSSISPDKILTSNFLRRPTSFPRPLLHLPAPVDFSPNSDNGYNVKMNEQETMKILAAEVEQLVVEGDWTAIRGRIPGVTEIPFLPPFLSNPIIPSLTHLQVRPILQDVHRFSILFTIYLLVSQ